MAALRTGRSGGARSRCSAASAARRCPSRPSADAVRRSPRTAAHARLPGSPASPSAAAATATSPPRSACRRSTASAPSAAAPTPTTSTSVRRHDGRPHPPPRGPRRRPPVAGETRRFRARVTLSVGSMATVSDAVVRVAGRRVRHTPLSGRQLVAWVDRALTRAPGGGGSRSSVCRLVGASAFAHRPSLGRARCSMAPSSLRADAAAESSPARDECAPSDRRDRTRRASAVAYWPVRRRVAPSRAAAVARGDATSRHRAAGDRPAPTRSSTAVTTPTTAGGEHHRPRRLRHAVSGGGPRARCRGRPGAFRSARVAACDRDDPPPAQDPTRRLGASAVGRWVRGPGRVELEHAAAGRACRRCGTRRAWRGCRRCRGCASSAGRCGRADRTARPRPAPSTAARART